MSGKRWFGNDCRQVAGAHELEPFHASRRNQVNTGTTQSGGGCASDGEALLHTLRTAFIKLST